MENQDSQTLGENSDSRDFNNYIQLALSIGEQHTRSRGGFGAFRQFRDICRNSMGLVFESGFFAIIIIKRHFICWTTSFFLIST